MQFTDTTYYLSLLRKGYRTDEIANLTGNTEAHVYNAMYAQREAENTASRARAYGREYQARQRALDKVEAER